MACVAAIVAAFLWPDGAGEKPVETSPSGKLLSFEASDWVNELRRGARVEFVREPARVGDPLDVVGEFQGLGTLPADQLSGLLGSIGVEASAVALSNSMEQAESGDPQDYVSFLKERNTFEKVKVADIMAREGDYVTVESGKRLPPMPEGFVRIGQLRAGSVGDKKVDVYFIFDLSLPRNEAIKDTKSDWEQAEALLADEDVRAFNLQSLGVRQNKIKQHMAAMNQINGVSGRLLSDEVRRRLQGQLLPRHFIVDQQHYIVTRLIRRRY